VAITLVILVCVRSKHGGGGVGKSKDLSGLAVIIDPGHGEAILVRMSKLSKTATAK